MTSVPYTDLDLGPRLRLRLLIDRFAAPAARMVLAGVWLHQGLWAKILDQDPSHRAIVGRLPGIGPESARRATIAIGLLEGGMAAWVLTGYRPRACAAAQTLLMAGFNAGALTFARERIANPGRLLVRNSGLVALAWLATL